MKFHQYWCVFVRITLFIDTFDYYFYLNWIKYSDILHFENIFIKCCMHMYNYIATSQEEHENRLGFHESKNNKMIYMNEPIGP